jgi:cytochrome c-type biogenesis protein CcsB
MNNFSNENFLVQILFDLTLISTILFWFSLNVPKIQILRKLSCFISLNISFILFYIISRRWIISGYFPLSNLYESLMFLTICLIILQLIVDYKSQTSMIGSLILPICVFLVGFSTSILPNSMQKTTPLVPALQSNWLLLHVSMMMLSYSALIFGSLLAIVYLFIQRKKEKTKISPVELYNKRKSYFLHQYAKYEAQVLYYQINKFDNLLKNLDLWSYRIIGIGFPCLTIGIISGAVWANEAWGSYWSWDPKETWALITWIVFASYLHARLIRNWKGQKTALLGALGFFVIWVCYLGVNFLGTGLHSYGWLT